MRRYTYKMTIFLEQINLSVAQIELCLDAKHWDLSRHTFAKKHRSTLHQIGSNLHSHLWPLHTAIASTTATAAAAAAVTAAIFCHDCWHASLLCTHRYCCRHRFCCSLMIVVCPSVATAAADASGSVFSTATVPPLVAAAVVMIVIVIKVAVVVAVIVVTVPVAFVNNGATPSLCRSLCRRSSPSLLSWCFPCHHCRCLHRLTAPASNVNVTSVSAAAAAYQLPWSTMTCCCAKVYFSQHYT